MIVFHSPSFRHDDVLCRGLSCPSLVPAGLSKLVAAMPGATVVSLTGFHRFAVGRLYGQRRVPDTQGRRLNDELPGGHAGKYQLCRRPEEARACTRGRRLRQEQSWVRGQATIILFTAFPCVFSLACSA